MHNYTGNYVRAHMYVRYADCVEENFKEANFEGMQKCPEVYHTEGWEKLVVWGDQ